MKIKFLSAAIAIVSVMAVAACSSGGTNAGGGGTGGTGGGGSVGGGGSGGGGGTGGGGATESCHDCACANATNGCSLVCDDMTAGVLNFCTAGQTTGSQCSACVATNCGGVALADCN
jgi:hypothetical protein